VSLMHAGRLLAVGAPEEIRARRGAASLEDAFVAYLKDAAGKAPEAPVPAEPTAPRPLRADHAGIGVSLRRIWAFARREMTEVLRDRVRLAFALLGPLLLMVALGYGITFDVEDIPFAVYDRDASAQSRRLVESFAGSRYFTERAPLESEDAIDRRLRSGELRVAIDIPPGFGRDLLTGHRPEVAFFLDGAMPFRAETARGYINGIVVSYAQDLARESPRESTEPLPVRIEPRFRYNQDFRSTVAVTPGSIMLLVLLIPAMLCALAVVREREIGSISNLYASPATVGEFLLGKQVPYVVIGFASFVSLVGAVELLFGVTIKGSVMALALGAVLYVIAATAFGLLVSTFVRTQVAAILGTAILVTVPAINFSGYLYPAAALEGAGRVIGLGFPALWFQNISLGTFSKGRDFEAFGAEYLVLATFGLGFLLLARLLLRKQER
jgi:ribosome-dependent ATPase